MKNKITDLVCRQARDADTADMLELTRTIWEGHDYIPQVWAEWLADPEGQLAVAEWQGRVVGLGKLTRLSQDDWWLEGLRTHPELEGRGIAARLHEHLLGLWLDTGSGTLRLATASFRLPVQHLCERTGFDKVGEFTEYGAQVLEGGIDNFQPLAIGESAEALEVALKSESLAFSGGLIDLGWRWTTPSRDFLREAAEKGKAWWWRGRQGVLALTEDTDDEGQTFPLVELLACPIAEIPALLQDFRRLAKSQGYAKAIWGAPTHPDLQPLLEAGGFRREWDAAVFIYAKRHPVV
jgi:GNAT superfamily N-acetyltransferase